MATSGDLPDMPLRPSGTSSRKDEPRSDADLMLALRDHDSAAMEVLVRRYGSSLKGFASTLVESDDEAEDVVQETFTRLWERRSRWDTSQQRGTVRAFLYSVARNLALNNRRAARTRARLSSNHQIARSSVTPVQDMDASELHEAFREALESLPRRRREVFILARYHDLSYREIGEQLGISPQTVANHLSAALNDLRSQLRDHL